MKRFAALAAAFMVIAGMSAAPAPAAPLTTSAATNLNWGSPIPAGSDEFNYTGSPDSTKWSLYKGPGHHNKGRRVPGQNTVANGALSITGLSNGDTGGMSSKFRGKTSGKWETRMKVNTRDSEYHPVLILWPDTGGNKTTEAEIDYAESTSDTGRVKFFLHYGKAGTKTQTSASKVIDMTVYHNYAVSWTPSAVVGYIDGVEWFRDSKPGHVPTMPMHQTLQLDWFPDGTALTLSRMDVDWTRAYN